MPLTAEEQTDLLCNFIIETTHASSQLAYWSEAYPDDARRQSAIEGTLADMAENSAAIKEHLKWLHNEGMKVFATDDRGGDPRFVLDFVLLYGDTVYVAQIFDPSTHESSHRPITNPGQLWVW